MCELLGFVVFSIPQKITPILSPRPQTKYPTGIPGMAWSCPACAFVNNSSAVCGICDTARSGDATLSEANRSLETIIILSDDDDLPAEAVPVTKSRKKRRKYTIPIKPKRTERSPHRANEVAAASPPTSRNPEPRAVVHHPLLHDVGILGCLSRLLDLWSLGRLACAARMESFSDKSMGRAPDAFTTIEENQALHLNQQVLLPLRAASNLSQFSGFKPWTAKVSDMLDRGSFIFETSGVKWVLPIKSGLLRIETESDEDFANSLLRSLQSQGKARCRMSSIWLGAGASWVLLHMVLQQLMAGEKLSKSCRENAAKAVLLLCSKGHMKMGKDELLDEFDNGKLMLSQYIPQVLKMLHGTFRTNREIRYIRKVVCKEIFGSVSVIVCKPQKLETVDVLWTRISSNG